MPIKYKINVMAALKEKGYSSTRLRNEGILGEATMTRLRREESVSYDVLAKLCKLLNCQIGDILVYVPDDYNNQRLLLSTSTIRAATTMVAVLIVFYSNKKNDGSQHTTGNRHHDNASEIKDGLHEKAGYII